MQDLNPAFSDKDKKSARRKIKKLQQRMDELQFQLYAENKRSLLICLQAPDAGGKDGVVRHVIGSMNPQGCRVVPFKQPSAAELAHDFLWRVEQKTPKRDEVVIFNRSHYEDALVVRVHNLVPEKVWSQRFEQINDFERRLAADNTHILKFFLHVSKEEQLEHFKRRLDDPAEALEDQRGRLFGARKLGRLPGRVRRCDQQMQHRRRALVCYSFRSQMVPRPVHLAHYYPDHGTSWSPSPEPREDGGDRRKDHETPVKENKRK